MKPAYAGIGSRETPPDVCDLMTRLAGALEKAGYVLRSGGAAGADTAFQMGVKDDRNMEIYLPWPRFNGHRGIVTGKDECNDALSMKYYEWRDAKCRLIKKGEPAWRGLSEGARDMMRRNLNQIGGPDIPAVMKGDLRGLSKFVVCWTPNGLPIGGTGQALRLALAFQIPIRNLWNPEAREAAEKFIAGMK